ncbi:MULTISPECIES: hypothetical protein [Amycolatopsis]|uniref:Uncharacterized protein n=1 Tax=Amycolatopsis albidoflavus TaxID=102226 RepID=A0ABW5HZ28_9PSEU
MRTEIGSDVADFDRVLAEDRHDARESENPSLVTDGERKFLDHSPRPELRVVP